MREMRRLLAQFGCRLRGHEWSDWSPTRELLFEFRVCLLCPARETRDAITARMQPLGAQITASMAPIAQAATQAAHTAARVLAAPARASDADPSHRAAGGEVKPDVKPSPWIFVGTAANGLVWSQRPAPEPSPTPAPARAPSGHDATGMRAQAPPPPACAGHERVIRELKAEIKRLNSENWQLRHRRRPGVAPPPAPPGPDPDAVAYEHDGELIAPWPPSTSQHDPDGSTTHGGAERPGATETTRRPEVEG